MIATPKERFWAKVDKRGEDDCWEWIGGRSWDRYGSFWAGERSVYAHRFAYELAIGPVPEGLQVRHLCGSRACVNPAHLELAANQESGQARSPNAESVRAYKRRHRDKHRARKIVRQAVERGLLIRPTECEECGAASDRIEAHHEDYTRRLDVVWLCSRCHYAKRGQ